MKRIAIIGNCHADGIAAAVEMLTGVKVESQWRPLKRGETTVKEIASRFDLLFYPRYREDNIEKAVRIIRYLPVTFTGFHPDNVTVANQEIRSNVGNNHSAIILWSFLNGLSPKEAISLFTGPVFEHLGYFDNFKIAKRHLLREAKACGLPLAEAFERWAARGAFMHVRLHPKGFVLGDIAAMLARKAGLPITGEIPESFDPLGRGARWPVYPEIAERLGIPNEGSYWFDWFDNGTKFTGDLETFVTRCYETYATIESELDCKRIKDDCYQDLRRFLPTRRKSENKSNPYRDLPGYCWWKNSVAAVPPAEIDPVVSPRFKIAPATKVATAGSCFAQHISRSLRASGYTYFSAEGPASQATFSARFGNIYTARQLLQLWRRAHGLFTPDDVSWARPDGRLVDPFRPEIEPDGFATPHDVLAERDRHLAAVREMFERLDVLVFTLGLTEAWRSRVDGAVFPLPPGAVSSEIKPEQYEFINFDIDSVREDLCEFLDCLHAANPRAKVLLTVSPVPLIATYERRHALVSTAYSKAVLRVAAEKCLQRYDWVDYLPSFEVITSAASRGRYFADDLRSVTPDGVAHVMRVFFKHYAAETPRLSSPLEREFLEDAQFVCDEESIERSAQAL